MVVVVAVVVVVVGGDGVDGGGGWWWWLLLYSREILMVYARTFMVPGARGAKHSPPGLGLRLP